MRVLDTHSGQFVQIDPQQEAFAILSHTWDHEKGEQPFAELFNIQRRYAPKRAALSQVGFHGKRTASSATILTNDV